MEFPDGAGAGDTASAGGRRRFRAALLAGVVLSLAVTGLGAAAAQTEAPPETGNPGPAGAEPGPGPRAGARAAGPKGFGPKGFGPRGFGPGGFGLAGVIHGEFTVPGSDGGFQTLATQAGEVVSVSRSRIELKSEDGFTRAYSVTEDTLVNAGRDGIDDVARGDQLRVLAVVQDGEPRAVRVVDETRVRASVERWRPGRR